MFMGYQALFSLAAIVLDNLLDITVAGTSYGYTYLLFALAVLVPTISASVRRLHDVDKSGWHLLAGLVPVVGTLYLLYLLTADGTRSANQYGPDSHRVFAY